jgi:sulfite reductase beta subunit-like hemoprotein
VPAEALPSRIEAMLRVYLAHRREGETFHAFAGRHTDSELIALFAAATAA